MNFRYFLLKPLFTAVCLMVAFNLTSFNCFANETANLPQKVENQAKSFNPYDNRNSLVQYIMAIGNIVFNMESSYQKKLDGFNPQEFLQDFYNNQIGIDTKSVDYYIEIGSTSQEFVWAYPPDFINAIIDDNLKIISGVKVSEEAITPEEHLLLSEEVYSEEAMTPEEMAQSEEMIPLEGETLSDIQKYANQKVYRGVAFKDSKGNIDRFLLSFYNPILLAVENGSLNSLKILMDNLKDSFALQPHRERSNRAIIKTLYGDDVIMSGSESTELVHAIFDPLSMALLQRFNIQAAQYETMSSIEDKVVSPEAIEQMEEQAKDLENNQKIIDYLVDHEKIDLKYRNFFNLNAMDMAIITGHIDLVKKLHEEKGMPIPETLWSLDNLTFEKKSSHQGQTSFYKLYMESVVKGLGYLKLADYLRLHNQSRLSDQMFEDIKFDRIVDSIIEDVGFKKIKDATKNSELKVFIADVIKEKIMEDLPAMTFRRQQHDRLRFLNEVAIDQDNLYGVTKQESLENIIRKKVGDKLSSIKNLTETESAKIQEKKEEYISEIEAADQVVSEAFEVLKKINEKTTSSLGQAQDIESCGKLFH